MSLEQLLPSHGTPQGEFNRGIYNRHLGLSHRAYDKYVSMVKPFTTSGYISGSTNINTVQSYAGKGLVLPPPTTLLSPRRGSGPRWSWRSSSTPNWLISEPWQPGSISSAGNVAAPTCCPA